MGLQVVNEVFKVIMGYNMVIYLCLLFHKTYDTIMLIMTFYNKAIKNSTDAED